MIRPADQSATVRAVQQRAQHRRRRARTGLVAGVVMAAAAVSALVLTVGNGPGTTTLAVTAPTPSAPPSTAAAPSTTAPQPTTTPPTPTRPTSQTVPVATTNLGGAHRAISTPAPLPPPCPPVTAPAWINSTFCGPPPPPGDGSGPDGECVSGDSAPPCGPGVVPDRYYAYTLPGACDGLVLFDGRQWVSELPPSTPSPPQQVWMSMGADGTGLAFIAPTGAVAFLPYTGQPLNACQPPPTFEPITP